MNLNNKYCEPKDIDYIKNIYSKEMCEFVTKSDDCLFKNFSIYDFVLKNNLTGNKCIDIGAGTSRLGYLLAEKFNDVYIIDLAEQNPFTKLNLHHIRENFFNWAENQQGETYDLIVESCAITHFEYNEQENIGIEKCAKYIYKLLKPNSYFLMSSDVIEEKNNNDIHQKEFIKASNIIEIFTKNNFKIVSNFDKSSSVDACSIILDYNNNPNFTLKYSNFIFKKE